MTDHTALIEALERAEGPSRELDARIDALLKGRTGFEWKGYFYNCDQLVNAGGSEVPEYTASIDAALTLVPEGWRIYTADFSVFGRARWGLSGPKTQWATDENGEKCAGDDWYQSAIAKTPAIALVIAALRAKGAQS